MLRAHTTRDQWKVSTMTTAQPRSRPAPAPLGGSSPPTPVVLRVQIANMPATEATAQPHRAIHARTHRRVASASIEIAIPKTASSHTKTCDGNAMRSVVASGPLVSTSSPLAEPACMSSSDTMASSTQTATTMPRAPGSISPATLRSAFRRSFS